MKLPLVSIVIPTYNRKDKLARLLESILNSNYPKDKIEIIVVDDASTDGTYGEIQENFPSVNVIRNERERLLAGSRNVGIKNSRGKFIFFIDDDNVVDQNTISELIKTMMGNEKIGVAGPIMYYYKDPRIIWCAGIRRNYITSETTVVGRDEIDRGQFKQSLESEDFPNAFMIQRKTIEKAGMFDEVNFPIHYDESDFCNRARNAGYDIYCVTSAKIWHDTLTPSELHRGSQIQNPNRAYYAGRNRVLFHRKYNTISQFLFFLSVPLPIITIYYIFQILKSNSDNKYIISLEYLKGTFKGIMRNIHV